MTKQPNRYHHFLLLSLSSIALLQGCEKHGVKVSSPPVPSVKVQIVIPKDEIICVDYPARVSGIRQVEVHARVNGILQHRFYHEGQFVKQGEILVQLDAAPYQANVDKAQATLLQTERNWRRALDLYVNHAISGQECDAAVADYERAKSDLRTAQIHLEYTSIRAPISGVIGKESYSEGSLLQPGTDRSLVTRIVQLDPVYIEFSYSDQQWTNWRQQALDGSLIIPERPSVSLQLTDRKKYPYAGYVDFTDCTIDSSTASVKARAVIPNPETMLLPGQFVRLSLQDIVKPQAVALPEKAIIYSLQGPFVYIVNSDNKVEIRPIALGALSVNGRIVTGLQAKERVIVEGMIKVSPGQVVTIESNPSVADGIHCSHCGHQI